jgi:uncharacterized protein (DUF924 family)
MDVPEDTVIAGAVMHEQVLTFWFRDIEPKSWWAPDPAFDNLLRERFLPLLDQASKGELYSWRSSPRGRLAEILVLDQFSRNIHRDTPQAFFQDPAALVLSQESVALGCLEKLEPMERVFLLMPYMHSESPVIHVEAERLFKLWVPEENYRYELRHKAIIDRFGRYPHRNSILERESRPEEIEFLKQPGSGF